MNLRNERMCLSKKLFWSAEEADTRALEINEELRAKKEPANFRYYQCPNCFQWHLTSGSVKSFVEVAQQAA